MESHKHLPWITGPLDEKADFARNETSNETKLTAEGVVVELKTTGYQGSKEHAPDAPVFIHHGESTSIELFYDLFFVANLSTFTANHEVDTPGSEHFVSTAFPVC
jgi:hypothetical protein